MKRIETVLGPNPWAVNHKNCQNCGREHCCYFCQHEGCYDPMPTNHTLCARCGQLIFGDVLPRNEAMDVCERCEAEIAHEIGAAEAMTAAVLDKH
jgi:hypothetical protein